MRPVCASNPEYMLAAMCSQYATSLDPSVHCADSAAHRAGQRSRRICVVRTAAVRFQRAMPLVYALSSTGTWYSSGPITPSMWWRPSVPRRTREAQKRAVSTMSSAPASSANASSPVARQYCQQA
jgi:hypothetical protein